ncbi:hypothetical protein EST38_g4391 [Candolleomyces aberdarensis]|uniref:Uncharacterized protein n=1 Tax=Candolleomyces aberdarensis TaxID=2316362 RepID=A0A4Q2DN82_9AGAR|nr:hypothetical protein EST38_g4391 [Candolleomyces aberdarensis]
MRTSIVPRLFVILYLFISFSELLAAPAPRNDAAEPVPAPVCSGTASPSTSSDPVELRPAAKTFIKWLGVNGASHSKICFYSGSTGTTGVWRNMGTISATLGCDWITSLLTLAGIDDTETSQWTDTAEWSATSRALATIARNEAIVILGETYREDSVWNTVELPTLRSSRMLGWVTKIDQYTMQDAAGKIAGPHEIQ